jgi:hypothetical protein
MLDSSRTLNSGWTICHNVWTNATLSSSKLLDTNGCPDGKFSLSGWMLLTDECPDVCKGTELTDLNSAQSLLEAHN